MRHRAGHPTASQWVRLIGGEPQAGATRLFCLPYAGGGSSIYLPWATGLPEKLGLYAIQLPGRESRFREAPITHLEPMLEALGSALLPYLDGPFAFFGHSMGALIGWELARYLSACAHLSPDHLFVSASAPPGVVRERQAGLHLLPDGELVAALRQMNGTPPEVLADRELLDLVLPAIRADMGLLANYTLRPGPLVSCPVTVFGGDRDPLVPPGELHGWADFTTADTEVQLLSGDHFYLHTARAELIVQISRRLGL